jgi:hypothetical protein
VTLVEIRHRELPFVISSMEMKVSEHEACELMIICNREQGENRDTGLHEILALN